MDCLSERAESRAGMMRVWGGNGKTPNSLAVFIQAVYHEEKGHGLLCPEMNKKIIFSVCFITGNHFSRIRADKSFREKRGRMRACVWSITKTVCVCVLLCLFTHVHVSVWRCATTSIFSMRLFGWMVNQTPSSNSTAESWNFNISRPTDTNRLGHDSIQH